MGSYLRDNKEALRKEIAMIENLQQSYDELTSLESGRNAGNAINAYRSWYNKTVVICNAIFGPEDADVKEFRALDNNCNGFGMYDNYVAIEGTYAILKNRLYELVNHQEVTQTQELNTVNENIHPIVFISHAGNDKDIVELFIDWILKNIIGLKDHQIICTSFEKNTTAIGNDIPAYIKKTIKEADLVISFVSRSYKESEVCLNEVGAAWALGKEPLQLVLPDADFEDLGWLMETRKAAKIVDSNSLSKFVESVCNHLSLPLPSITIWNDYSVKFYQALQKLKENAISVQDEVRLVFDEKEYVENDDKAGCATMCANIVGLENKR